jgi:hypothetical protein
MNNGFQLMPLLAMTSATAALVMGFALLIERQNSAEIGGDAFATVLGKLSDRNRRA